MTKYHIRNYASFKSLILAMSFLWLVGGTGCHGSQDQEWKLVWQDEFNDPQLDTSKWSFETGATGWGNNEWQNYTAGENIEIKNGKLHIIAQRQGEGQKPGDYTSSRLNSTETFTYGRVEVRAKMPDYQGKGLWPAIWMLGENIGEIGWPLCGEIDIMEYVSYEPNTVHQTIHSKANNHIDGTQITSGPRMLESIEEEFHTYGLIWKEDFLSLYVDTPDNAHLTFQRPSVASPANWPFDTPFYIILNLAVGGNWGGKEGVDDDIFPAAMVVDYVRVWQ